MRMVTACSPTPTTWISPETSNDVLRLTIKNAQNKLLLVTPGATQRDLLKSCLSMPQTQMAIFESFIRDTPQTSTLGLPRLRLTPSL